MSARTKCTGELTKLLGRTLSDMDEPLDTNETRAIILLAHHLKDVRPLWEAAQRPTMTNYRYSAWKFCALLHKLLREGPGQLLADGLRHKERLQEIAMLWVWQRDPLAQCIAQYCKVLLAKLNFHSNYAVCFDGQLEFTHDIASNDLGMSFQLCYHIANYLDELLQLQRCIFNALRCEKLTAKSKGGRFRLSPLLTVAEECTPLYRHYEALMWLLCTNLPTENVSGLHTHFNHVYHQLQHFHAQLAGVPYLCELLGPSVLPATVPEFALYREEIQKETAAVHKQEPTAPPEWQMD